MSLLFLEIKYILKICIDEAFSRKDSSWIQFFVFVAQILYQCQGSFVEGHV